MVSINSNYAATFAAKAAKQTTSELNSAMEKLSTGKRINYARDDAAGQAISVRLTAEIQGLAMASRNASDGQAMVDTAEGALQETQTLLLRMRELAVQSSNGTLASADRASLEKEFGSLEAEITRIADTSSWAGQMLLDGSLSDAITFQAGTKAGTANLITVSIGEMSASAATRVNLSASQGRIEDADFATETGNLAKNQILQQAATAMIAQANSSKSSVLNLLRG